MLYHHIIAMLVPMGLMVFDWQRF